MTNEELDEIEKLADEWHRTGLTQYAEKVADNALPLVKALREAWQDREDYRNDAIAAEKECDRMLTSTALLTYLVEELLKMPSMGGQLAKLVEQSRTHLLRLREYEGSDE